MMHLPLLLRKVAAPSLSTLISLNGLIECENYHKATGYTAEYGPTDTHIHAD